MDISERYYGMIKITVEAEPIMGHPPKWANVIDIANECLAMVIARKKQAEEQVDAALRG